MLTPTDAETRWLFFWSDPRLNGCPHHVVDGVDFIDNPPRSDEWHLGPPEASLLARSNRSPLKFKAFRSELDVPISWEIVDAVAEVWSTWEAFMRAAHRQPR